MVALSNKGKFAWAKYLGTLLKLRTNENRTNENRTNQGLGVQNFFISQYERLENDSFLMDSFWIFGELSNDLKKVVQEGFEVVHFRAK